MQVVDGAVDVLEAEAGSLNAADLYKRVLPFSGMGPFTAANVLQLLGVLPYAVEPCSRPDSTRSPYLHWRCLSCKIPKRNVPELPVRITDIRAIRQSMVSLPGALTISKG